MCDRGGQLYDLVGIKSTGAGVNRLFGYGYTIYLNT